MRSSQEVPSHSSAPADARGGPSPGQSLSLLITAVLLLGVSESMAGPYLVLFGAQRAHLSPFAIGVFVSLVAVSGIVVSSLLGRQYDKAPARWPCLLAISSSATGYALLTTTTSYALLLTIAAVLLGTGTAAFAQLFALARGRLHGGQAAQSALKGTAALRSVWSLAWAIGPLIGAALLPRYGFTGLFLATASGFALVAVPLLPAGRPRRPSSEGAIAADGAPGGRSMALFAASFALFNTAMYAGSVILPLYVTDSLHRPNGDVGFLYSVGAIVEIPAALALMLLPAGTTKARLILAGMALQAVYFVVIGLTPDLPVLVTAQIARGIAIATVGALGITYFQELIPNATGRATTLFANTSAAGSLVAGVFAGTTAQILGYRPVLLICGAISALGSVLLETARRRHRPGQQA